MMAFPFGPFWSAAASPEEDVWVNAAWQDRITHTKRTLPKRLVIFIMFCFCVVAIGRNIKLTRSFAHPVNSVQNLEEELNLTAESAEPTEIEFLTTNSHEWTRMTDPHSP